MRREPLKYSLFAVLAIFMVIELFLLFSGNRILLSEEYFPEHPGVMGTAIYPEDAKYECTYFTGRKKVSETVPADQIDECPFIWTER